MILSTNVRPRNKIAAPGDLTLDVLEATKLNVNVACVLDGRVVNGLRLQVQHIVDVPLVEWLTANCREV